MNPGVNKGSAVEAVQRDLGVTADQTAIFGDFLNDLEMMPMAKWSFAMANGLLTPGFMMSTQLGVARITWCSGAVRCIVG
jgi:3-deoxy-D-manno-octulosonate 8-phosphate phosphatase KdsC-like HAD superfamily phosphatase